MATSLKQATAIMERVKNSDAKPTSEDYDEVLRKPPALRDDQDVFKLAFLTKGIPYFQKLGPAVTLSLCRVMNVLYVRGADRVFSQGDIGDKLYIIVSGGVAIVAEVPLAPGEDASAGWQVPPREESMGVGPEASTDSCGNHKPLSARSNKSVESVVSEHLRSEIEELELQIMETEEEMAADPSRPHPELEELRVVLETKQQQLASLSAPPEDGTDSNHDSCTVEKKKPTLKKGYKFHFLVAFKAGDSFGEIALESEDCMRKATVFALQDTKFVTIQKEDYDRVLKKMFEEKRQEDVTFMRTVSCFMSWPGDQLAALRPLMATVNLTHGNVVCKEGEHAQNLWLLTSGRVRVTKRVNTHPRKHLQQQYSQETEVDDGSNFNHPLKSQGVDIPIALLGPGEIFGEASVLRGTPCHETVTVDCGVATFWTLAKMDVGRKFDSPMQKVMLRESELKRQFRFSRMQEIIHTMFKQAKKEQVKKRGCIHIAYPNHHELVSMAKETPHLIALKRKMQQKRDRELKHSNVAGSIAWASRSRPSTPDLRQECRKRGRTPLYPNPPPSLRSASAPLPSTALPAEPTPAQVVPTAGPAVTSGPATQVEPTTASGPSSFFMTQSESFVSHSVDDRRLFLSSWRQPEPHSVNLGNRLSALSLGDIRTPHIELDIDLVEDLTLES